MILTEHEKQLISLSFAKIAPIAGETAKAFYAHLFEIAPETQALFANIPIQAQGNKLMQTLAIIVSSLHDLSSLVPAIQSLGERHIAYGVSKQDYASVGTALIWALEQNLGADFSPQTKAAWIRVYGILADVATSYYVEISS